MKHEKILLSYFLVGLVLLPVSVNAESGLIEPKKGSVYYSLLKGLKLLAVGDIEQWINSSCDGIRLCSNATEINDIRNHRAKFTGKNSNPLFEERWNSSGYRSCRW